MSEQAERNASYLIETVGTALYGHYAWQISLADDLNITTNTLRQWRNGRRPMPPVIWKELLRLLSKARAQIDQAERELTAELPRLAPEIAAEIEG